MGGGYSGDGGWLEDAVVMVGGWRVQGGVQASYIYIYGTVSEKMILRIYKYKVIKMPRV